MFSVTENLLRGQGVCFKAVKKQQSPQGGCRVGGCCDNTTGFLLHSIFIGLIAMSCSGTVAIEKIATWLNENKEIP